jgi:hypothetical protein
VNATFGELDAGRSESEGEEADARCGIRRAERSLPQLAVEKFRPPVLGGTTGGVLTSAYGVLAGNVRVVDP